MAVTIGKFISHLGPPVNEVKATDCLASAKSKARTAGIPSFQRNAQYDIFIINLATMYYDNGGMTFADPKDAENAQKMINGYVHELRYAEEDPVVPEGGESG